MNRIRTSLFGILLTAHAVFFALASDSNCADREPLPGYATSKDFVMPQHGVSGVRTLRLQMDRRLSDSLFAELWDTGPWDTNLDEESPEYKVFQAEPPHNAILSILDGRGQVITSRILETPLAKLEPLDSLNPGNPQSFLLTQDYSSDNGYHEGPVSTLLIISEDSLCDVNAIDTLTGKESPIRLVKSGGEEWRWSGTGQILSASCYPNYGDTAHDTTKTVQTLVRYSFEGSRWLRFQSKKFRYCESGDPFPARSEFP